MTALRSALDARQAALVLITGRRRIGKSRLIREACSGRTVIYLRALDETARLNFETFKRLCLNHFGFDAAIDRQTDWLGLLSSLAIAAKAMPGLIIVLDNFNALYEADETLPLSIRTFWQSGLPGQAGLKLILCDSNITRMTELACGNPVLVKQALSACKPLFLDLFPLPLHESAGFFPGYTDEARIAASAIFGGVPAYLEACRPDRPLRANIVDLLLSPLGKLYDEPAQLLVSDLRDVKVYASILRAISNGYRESSEIRGFVMGEHSGVSISSYLERLRAMRLINDVRTLDAGPKARYIRFAISDPLTRFWNLFIQPNRVAIDRGDGDALFETTIKPQLGAFMITGFEDICRDFTRLHAQSLFGAPAEAVGQIWGPGYDIAVAGRLNDHSAVFGACEWHTRPVGDSGAEYLIKQASQTSFAAEDPMAPGQNTPPAHFVMFSRSGFTPEVQERARLSDTLKLVTPTEIVRTAA